MNLDEEPRDAFVSESERREPPVDALGSSLAADQAARRRPWSRPVWRQAVVAVIGIGAFGFAQSARTATLPRRLPTAPSPRPRGLGLRRPGCLDPGTYRVWLGTATTETG